MTLETPLASLEWLPPQRVRQLSRFGLITVEDLLTQFPRRYEDRTEFDRFPTGESDAAVCVCGVVSKTVARRIRGRQKMFDVVLEEPEAHALSQPLVCRWFNSHWVEKLIATGQQLVVYGKPKRSGSSVVIAHPEFEAIEEGSDTSIHLKRIAPIHGATEGLSPRVMRALVWQVLAGLDLTSIAPRMPRVLDPIGRGEALRQIHFPDSWTALEKARRHLVLEEFFTLQISVAAKRAEQLALPGAAHCGPGNLMRRLHAALPFPLTEAQQRSIREIAADLAADRPMNRLLHGDVGSGKTLVALSAMLLVVESGAQAALMAPTQILAEQHYLSFKRLLEPLGIAVALRTGARTEDTAALPLFAYAGDASAPGLPGGLVVAGGGGRVPHATQPIQEIGSTPQIFIGTHALLYERAGITNLGLAVIDEQHKFGVLQRARLREHGVAPDVLVMTATPIPRTLTMTVYGDLEVSVLDELPAGRGKIITAVRDAAKLPEAVKFLRQQLEAGRQAYVVYPLIDESEKLEAKSAAAEVAKWQLLLAPMRCELLHGRIPPEEKDAIMQRFRVGETQALIATTVIEVGIDVPNANLLLVENAERFGLAQLHQLRGRIGRGEHKSYCILLNAKPDDDQCAEKLRILEETSDGFQIAEADLRLRGAGEMLGTAQTGMGLFKIGDPVADMELMQLARQHAQRILQNDPRLEREENRGYRTLLREQRKLTLAQVS